MISYCTLTENVFLCIIFFYQYNPTVFNEIFLPSDPKILTKELLLSDLCILDSDQPGLAGHTAQLLTGMRGIYPFSCDATSPSFVFLNSLSREPAIHCAKGGGVLFQLGRDVSMVWSTCVPRGLQMPVGLIPADQRDLLPGDCTHINLPSSTAV